MSLIVENGQGLPDADSYVTVAYVDEYAKKFGYTAWPPTIESTPSEDGGGEVLPDPDYEKKEVACRTASLYVDLRYASRLTGTRLNDEQGLEWPRKNARLYNGMIMEDGVIHGSILKAVAEAAQYAFKGVNLLPDVDGGPFLTSKSLASGAISKSWDPTSYGRMPVYKKIEALLYPLFGNMPSDTGDKKTMVSIPLRRGS